MKAVFDTNILIDYLNGVEQARVELSFYEEKIISVLTRIEVLMGAEDEQERKQLKAFLASFQLQELNTSIADKAVMLRKETRLKVPDAIIYATARDAGSMLVTRNTKDFKESWPDIRIPYQIGSAEL